jgi:hypothetical protein
LYGFVGNDAVGIFDVLGMDPQEFNLQKYVGACTPASAANLINLITNQKITTDQMIEAMVQTSTTGLTKKDIQKGKGGFFDSDLLAAMNKIGGVECTASNVEYKEIVEIKKPAMITVNGGGQKHAVVLVSVSKKGFPKVIDPYGDPDIKNQKCCYKEELDITLKEYLIFFKGGKVITKGGVTEIDGGKMVTRIITCKAK